MVQKGMVKELVFKDPGIAIAQNAPDEVIHALILEHDAKAQILAPGTRRKIVANYKGITTHFTYFVTPSDEAIVLETPADYIDSMQGKLKQPVDEADYPTRRLYVSKGPVYFTSQDGTRLGRVVYQWNS